MVYMDYPANSLRAVLRYEPRDLKFGTSGRRGEVAHLTQLEIYINALAELEYLLTLPREQGGIVRDDLFYFACDLRPSTTRFAPEHGGRGEIAQAIVRAIQDAGLKPVNLGFIPTPALSLYGLINGRGSIMVTGSHIPFDRNGYKTNTARGELLKKDEAPIGRQVEITRKRIYSESFHRSPFNAQGMLKAGHEELPADIPDARILYIMRYVVPFGAARLDGLRLLAYQHSAVGRDVLVEILRHLGATVTPAGRSDSFVPIDTENIDADQLATIQRLAAEAWRATGPFDAVVSTDGDSDRPLLLGVEPSGEAAEPCRVTFYSGDLLGMVAAEYLGADAVVVPISCNDAIDRGPLKTMLEPKTRVGSPYVVAGMEKAAAKGRRAVCGWEANGGFLTGSDLEKNGRLLRALPTRDAMLPLLCALAAMKERQGSLAEVFGRLPKRFGRAALLKNFPRETSRKIIARLAPSDEAVRDVGFETGQGVCRDEHGLVLTTAFDAAGVRAELARHFRARDGFGEVVKLDYTDGVRVLFSNGEVAHVRPSGNADELRIYAVADTQERASRIAALGVAEPDGILRRLAQAVA
jgi:phosphomannomutase